MTDFHASLDAALARSSEAAAGETEHFPEPCAVGGHGPVWCAECMHRWPCPATAEQKGAGR